MAVWRLAITSIHLPTSQPAEAAHREIHSVCDSYVSYIICHGHASNRSGTPCPCHSYREGGRPYVYTDGLSRLRAHDSSLETRPPPSVPYAIARADN